MESNRVNQEQLGPLVKFVTGKIGWINNVMLLKKREWKYLCMAFEYHILKTICTKRVFLEYLTHLKHSKNGYCSYQPTKQPTMKRWYYKDILKDKFI